MMEPLDYGDLLNDDYWNSLTPEQQRKALATAIEAQNQQIHRSVDEIIYEEMRRNMLK